MRRRYIQATGALSTAVASTMRYDSLLRLQQADAAFGSVGFVIALAGSLEKLGAQAGKATASKAAVRVASEYLKGATLQTIKQLFKQIGIIFTQKAAVKAIPYGVGVAIGSSGNYVLTRFVGAVARDVFILEKKSM